MAVAAEVLMLQEAAAPEDWMCGPYPAAHHFSPRKRFGNSRVYLQENLNEIEVLASFAGRRFL